MKLWGGRFSKQTDSLVQQFNASLPFDGRLYNEDITASMAWARGLARANILTTSEAKNIIEGLERVRQEFKQGTIFLDPTDEDIHTVVERRLTEIVGPIGGKLHTGRSRNDQVATDFRLWTLGAIDGLLEKLAELQHALVEGAKQQLHLALPGYTHLQPAQPVTWGHWLLSYFWALERDAQRLSQARSMAAVCPLGSGALAGTAFPVDRQALANELGFTSVSQNSLDAVSDRDFAADFLYAAAMLGLHLSRLAEQLIIFSSAEFGFVILDDAYSTGSSLMPQKKNPDTLELTRGKAGRLLGNLTGLLATLKGLPSTYDKDLQEDKEPVFDTYDTLEIVLPVVTGVIQTLKTQPDRMAARLKPELLATDLAEYLVKKGLPFRQAHEAVGQAVQLAEMKGVSLADLSAAELRSISDMFDQDALAIFDVQTSLASREALGGTAPQALNHQLTAAEDILAAKLAS